MRVKTTFLGATDTKGERIRVTSLNGIMTVPYDYAADSAHVAAIRRSRPEWANARVEYVDEHARGYWWDVTP